MSRAIGVSLFALLVASSAQAQQIGDVFYIALENHNFTQPSTVPAGTPEQLFGNSAAPFLNSLVTPGNPNAAMTSFASNYQNVAPGRSSFRAELRLAGIGRSTGRSMTPIPYPNNIVNAPNLSALLADEIRDLRLAVLPGGHRPCEHDRQQRSTHPGAASA